MFSNTAHPTAQSAASPARPLPDILQVFSQLFENTRPEVHQQASFAWWLIALVAAGAAARLWGLGDVGLHGDEETMAMAVQHILVDGRPILPSGMFYPRGMTQLYLMALSVAAFGESEWVLRLPSALCGVTLIPLAYLVGLRFLRPQWSLALAAAVAFLPDLIVYSQTARMYIFMITFVTASMACLFTWERTGRVSWLIAAVAAFIVGIDMQLLAVGTVLMFLLPGLLSGDLRILSYGTAAAAAGAVGFVAIDALTSAQYPVPPPEFAADFDLSSVSRPRPIPQFAPIANLALWLSGLVIAVLTLHVARAVNTRAAAWASAILLLAGVGLQLALFYHVAALCYVSGIALAVRHGSPALIRRVTLLGVAVGIVAIVHASVLAQTTDTIVRLVGSMIGKPSVWPYVRVAEPSAIAGVLVAALLTWGLYRFAQNEKISDFCLLAILAVFAPIFALGLFAWNVPSRYTAMSLIPMLLCAFAFAQCAADWLSTKIDYLRSSKIFHVVAATLTAALATNPPAAAATMNAGYRIHPDHKGAAEFMRSLPITDDDVVLAEDVLQQTYYLGEVDYWLIGPRVARHFITSTDDGVVDFYTGTPVIVSAAMLDKVLRENAGKRVFVIGSGEGQENNRRYVRGKELSEAIQSDRFDVIYTGRDGLTHVLRAVRGWAGDASTVAVPKSRASENRPREADDNSAQASSQTQLE
jgi:hypothetical protein